MVPVLKLTLLFLNWHYGRKFVMTGSVPTEALMMKCKVSQTVSTRHKSVLLQ